MRAHTPLRPHHHRPHPTPTRPHHPYRPHHTAPLATTHTWLHFECFVRIQRLPMRAHAHPRPHHLHRPHPPGPSPLHRPGSHFLGVERVFKGCQCVPTPPRALTTPTAHTPSHPGLATTHTWLAFPGCLESILKAANACPHFPAPTHTWLAFPRCLEV